jgi:hypothetical protein
MTGSRALHSWLAHTLGPMRIHPPVSPLGKGGEEGAVPPQFSPPYEGGVGGGSAGEDFECAQANCEAL